MNQTWDEAQKWEADWHGNCVNSINEELKQFVYMKKMGLKFSPNPKTPYNIDLQGKSVLDIGGGAYSLLLKCSNFKIMHEGGSVGAAVIDPIKHPKWVVDRYKSAGIFFKQMTGENINIAKDTPNNSGEVFDEIWIYNCLQHTIDPEQIIKNARAVGKLIRIFEWIDHPVSNGHLHTLTEENLNKWLGGDGKVENINEMGCNGKCYYGIFPA
jgi:2-polyprenyl-3-methyl-5-hydroxy-6-metoxy-1,4-benzoquinol methylase